MINYIKNWTRLNKEKKEKILKLKFYEIRSCITQMFEDLQISKGSVELPAWVECKNLMEKLKIDIEHPEIINFYYNRIKKHRRSNPIF